MYHQQISQQPILQQHLQQIPQNPNNEIYKLIANQEKLIANQDSRLISIENSIKNSKENVFTNCINSIQSLTKTIENLALETSLLKLKIGFQFDHKDDFLNFLKKGKDEIFEKRAEEKAAIAFERSQINIQPVNQTPETSVAENIQTKSPLFGLKNSANGNYQLSSPRKRSRIDNSGYNEIQNDIFSGNVSLPEIPQSNENSIQRINNLINNMNTNATKIVQNSNNLENSNQNEEPKLPFNSDLSNFVNNTSFKDNDDDKPKVGNEFDDSLKDPPKKNSENETEFNVMNLKNERLEIDQQLSWDKMTDIQTINATDLINFDNKKNETGKSDIFNELSMVNNTLAIDSDDEDTQSYDKNLPSMATNTTKPAGNTMKRLDYIDLKELTKVMRQTGRVNNKYECPIKPCSFSYSTYKSARLHMHSHYQNYHGIRSYGCSLCGARYSANKTLRRHFKNDHARTLQKSDVRFYRPNAKEYVLLEDCDPDEYIT